MTSPPDGVPYSQCRLPQRGTGADVPTFAARWLSRPGSIEWPRKEDSAFVPGPARTSAAGYHTSPGSGVTLLKHLQKLPKPAAEQRPPAIASGFRGDVR